MEYKKKFKDLPEELKNKFSSPEFMGRIHNLEQRFNVTLGKTVMRLMTGDLPMSDLVDVLEKEKEMKHHDAVKLKVIIYQQIVNPIQEELAKGRAELGPLPIEPGPQVIIRPKRKIINLKDIFEAEDGENAEATQEEVPKEIQDWKKEIAQIRTKEKKHETVVIETILSSLSTELSPEQRKKMSDIVSSRIKNIRDAVDTRLALGRSLDEGGLGLSGTEASEVSLLIEKKLKSRELVKDSIVNATTTKPINAERPIVQETIKSKPIAISKKPVVDFKDEKDVVPESKEKVSVKKPEPFIIPPKEEVMAPVERFIDPPLEKNEPINPSPPTKEKSFEFAKKKKIGLIGPIEELKEVKIEDWRSLYKTSGEAVSELKERLRVLKKDSFNQMVKGIAAWKKGNIMRLYIEVGAESAKDNMGIKENAESRKLKNISYLTEDEFHAIMDLNRDLRSYSL